MVKSKYSCLIRFIPKIYFLDKKKRKNRSDDDDCK